MPYRGLPFFVLELSREAFKVFHLPDAKHPERPRRSKPDVERFCVNSVTQSGGILSLEKNRWRRFYFFIYFPVPQQRVMNCVNSERFPADKGTFSALDPLSERHDIKRILGSGVERTDRSGPLFMANRATGGFYLLTSSRRSVSPFFFLPPPRSENLSVTKSHLCNQGVILPVPL